MESLVERGIRRCFDGHEFIENIVRREFLDEENFEKCDGKVDKLIWITIKSIMKRRMMGEEKRTKIWTKIKSIMRRRKKEKDIYHQCICKLIFREPIDFLDDFRKNGPTWSKSAKQRPKDGILRSDGPFVLALLNRALDDPNVYQLRVIVSRRALWLRFRGYYIAEIPNREGVEFDTYWAEKFARLCLEKRIASFILGMDTEGTLDFHYMSEYIQRELIDRLPRVVPSEPWSQVISKQRPVYVRYCDLIYNNILFAVLFTLHSNYHPENITIYWGY